MSEGARRRRRRGADGLSGGGDWNSTWNWNTLRRRVRKKWRGVDCLKALGHGRELLEGPGSLLPLPGLLEHLVCRCVEPDVHRIELPTAAHQEKEAGSAEKDYGLFPSRVQASRVSVHPEVRHSVPSRGGEREGHQVTKRAGASMQ